MGELISELKAEIDRLQVLNLDRTKLTHKALQDVERLTAEVTRLKAVEDAVYQLKRSWMNLIEKLVDCDWENPCAEGDACPHCGGHMYG